MVLSCAASPLGSPRPEAQANFQQLLKTKSCPGCDLAGANMIRMDLRGVDLEGANLAGAKLFLADLAGANLKNANLQGASLGGADLADADLRGANLTGAVLEGAFLETAKIDGDFITRPHAEEDSFAGSGEKVYVPAEDQSKQMPYTHDVAVGERQDLESPPPAIQDADPGDSDQPVSQSEVIPSSKPAQSLEPSVTEKATSKKMVPMADAVVLESEVKPEKSIPSVEEKPEQSKDLASSKELPAIEPVANTSVFEEKAIKPEAVAAVDQVEKSSVPEESSSVSQPQVAKDSTDKIEQVGAREGDIQVAGKPSVFAEDIVTGSLAGGATTQAVAVTEVAEPVKDDVPVKIAEDIDGTAPKAAPFDEVAASSVQKLDAAPPVQPQEEDVEGGIQAASKSPVVAEDIVTGSVAGGATAQAVAVAEIAEPAKSAEEIDGTVPRAASLDEVAAISAQKSAAAPPALPQDERVSGEEDVASPKQEKAQQADQSVSSMIAQIEEEAQQQPDTAAAVYTVETPEQAAARQQQIIEKLFDEERCVGCDLSGMDLAGKNFKEIDLERVNFQGCNLQGADFEEANLKGANFRDADLQNVDFSEADIYRADFSNANLTGARFDEALMDSANFTGATGLVLGDEELTE